PSTCTSVKPAIRATTAPMMIWVRAGVPRRAFVRLSERGSRPSRLIAKTTRARPRRSTITTVVRPTRLPIAMTFAAHVAPTSSNALASDGESSAARSAYDAMPVITIDTSRYSTVTIVSPRMMPRGTVRLGSRVSSALVATTSKPRKAKNTSAAPLRMPKTPYIDGSEPDSHENSDCVQTPPAAGPSCAGGTKGVKFSPSTKKNPTTITNITIATLMIVKTAFTRLDSRVPTANRAVNTPTISTGPQSNAIGPS